MRDAIRGNRTTLPTADKLAVARIATGYKHLPTDTEPISVSLNSPETKRDAGGIAKGYTADRMSVVLASMGHAHTLVDAGGDRILKCAPTGSSENSFSMDLFQLVTEIEFVTTPQSRTLDVPEIVTFDSSMATLNEFPG